MDVQAARAEGERGAFDAFQLARQRQAFGGVVDARRLSRAVDRLAGDDPVPLAWRIAGTADGAGRPAVEVELEGEVPLCCQSCLQPFLLPVRQQTLLLLAHDEAELARLDEGDEHEVVLAAGPLDARELVEDELLLTLPFVPRCGRTDCGAARDAGAEATAERTPSAFAVLAAAKAPASRKQKRRS
jgi:uncharacterized protein